MEHLKIFIDLTRLNKPIGFMLLFWPCSWGLAYAYNFNQNLNTFLYYLLLFFLLRWLYRQNKTRKGFLLGVYFIGIFTIRFLVEYVKESQGGFEKVLPLFSTGQWLSIPLILLGIGLILLSNRKIKTPTQ